ncbi:MAG: hypothetical protein ACRDFC_02290 [Ignavibacteria bacterium]
MNLKITISCLIILQVAFNKISYSQTGTKAKFPVIDGKINESEWQNSKIFTDFYITIPKTDEKYYDSTIVYVKQSKDAMFFAFKFYPRGKVISKSLIRDRSFDEENEFFILLDLENKNQNGYMFAFSFLNNQRDLLIYSQRNKSQEWDWIWECSSKIYSEAKGEKPGYIESEIKIPVDRIQNKNKKQIGFDIQMFAYKPDGTSYFYSIVPNSEVTTLKDTYKYDITPFEERLNFNFNSTPFVVGNKFNDSTYKASLGGEFNVSLDKHKLKATYNTDESTLEADPFRFSFYKRPIFLQEKRPFFSKDLDIYRTPIDLFYTRAIENIDYGFNYTFRSDKLKGGAVYVEEEKDTLGNKTKFFIARPNFNFKDFNVGSLFIYSLDRTNNYQEKILSLDGKLNLPLRFRFVPQFISGYNNQTGWHNAYNFNLYYEFNESGGPYGDLVYTRYDDKLLSSTLFNDYGNNYDEIFSGFGYVISKNRKYFPFINIYGKYLRARTLSDKFNYINGGSVEVFYKATGWLSFFHYFEINRPNDFDENNNVVVRKNFLQEHNFKILFGNNAVFAGYFFGPYFGTYLKNPYAELDLIFFDRISLKLNYNYRELFDIKQSIYSIKLDYKIMDKLYLRSFFQKDTYNRLALWNSLLQYEFFGGSSVYLVMNLEGDKLQYTRRYFKVGYEFNF